MSNQRDTFLPAHHVDAAVHWKCPECEERNEDLGRGGERLECLGCGLSVYVPVPGSEEHLRIAKERRDFLQSLAGNSEYDA